MRKLLATTALVAGTVGLAATSVAAAPPEPSPSIVDVAVTLSQDVGGEVAPDSNPGDFDILVTAVEVLGLDGVLEARRQLTVFAPTDAAFIELADLLNGEVAPAPDEAGALEIVAGVPGVADIVAFHVAPGARDASQVVPAERIRTITGQFITKPAGEPTLDAGLGRTASIVAADVAASNGIIHAIDAVLLP